MLVIYTAAAAVTQASCAEHKDRPDQGMFTLWTLGQRRRNKLYKHKGKRGTEV